MKKLICMVLVLCLLSGCAATPVAPKEPVTPTPVYDEAPIKNEKTVTFDGKFFEVLAKGENEYVRLSALAEAFGGTVNMQTDNAAPYTCTFSADGKLYSLATDSDLLIYGENDVELGYAPLFDGKEWYLPCRFLPIGPDYHVFEDGNVTYYTAYPDQMPDGVRLPILMYHAVGDDPWGIASLFVRPSELEKQLQYLQKEGYTTITFEDVDRLDEIEKPIMLTFDDGYEDNYSQLFPLLKKYNAKATVFVITGSIGTTHYLTNEQIKEMSDSGLVSIQSHTVSHPFLSDLGEEELEKELLGSKQALAKITGKEPFVICYPTGKSSALSRQVCEKYYSFGLLMNGGTFTTNGDNFRITRSYVSRSTDIYSYASLCD
ncbi:MAG: polysaccharide deacetylase family protein [Clostridia bacterium]|nr:polysaccharide deacetylase family protein [Clostridia bacterium]